MNSIFVRKPIFDIGFSGSRAAVKKCYFIISETDVFSCSVVYFQAIIVVAHFRCDS